METAEIVKIAVSAAPYSGQAPMTICPPELLTPAARAFV